PSPAQSGRRSPHRWGTEVGLGPAGHVESETFWDLSPIRGGQASASELWLPPGPAPTEGFHGESSHEFGCASRPPRRPKRPTVPPRVGGQRRTRPPSLAEAADGPHTS